MPSEYEEKSVWEKRAELQGVIVEESTGAQLARYRQLRAVQRDLHHVLIGRLPRQAIEDSGKQLGIYRDGGLAFGTMYESSVLLDYCIYSYRWDGQSVIQRYIADTPVGLDSDKKVLLDAMVGVRYSLFAVDELIRGLGLRTHDVFRGDGGYIMDVALSETAVKGSIIAAHVITPGDERFSMTTGAGLPVDRSIMEKIKEEILPRFGKTIREVALASRERPAEFSAAIIKICLEEDASSWIGASDELAQEAASPRPRVGRNEPCPCGSGKKFKRCCGRGG